MGRTGHEIGIYHISKTPCRILTKFTLYYVTCDIINSFYDYNHDNLRLACMRLKVMFREVAWKI